MPTDAAVAAIVLAAGTSSRFRAAGSLTASKLVAELDGRPLVRHVVDAAFASKARPVIVVTGCAHDAVEMAVGRLSARFVFNPDFADGLATSLKAGIAAVPPGAGAAAILLGDMPRITGDLLDLLIEAFAASPSASAAVPVFAGARCNPVVLGRRLFPAVLSLSGDQGARKLLAGDPGIIEVTVTDAAVALDIDTPNALAAAERRASAPGGSI